MKAFLMATPHKGTFTKNLFAILESRYEGLNMQTVSNNIEIASMLKNDIYDLAIVTSDKDALSLSTEIIASGLSMPILVYTETSYIPFIKELYGVGVSGVLNVGDDDNEILRAVADVLAKRIYISEHLKQGLLQAAIASDELATDIESICFSENFLHFSDITNKVPLSFIGGRIAFFTACLN